MIKKTVRPTNLYKPGSLMIENPDSNYKVTVTPSILTISSHSPRSLVNLSKGFDGLTLDGSKALRRLYKQALELSGQGIRPKMLLTFTFDQRFAEAEWKKIKESILLQVSRWAKKSGYLWYQQFQADSGHPHLHIYLNTQIGKSAMLEWARKVKDQAQGRVTPLQGVDVKPHFNFGYLGQADSREQAVAPYRGRWGKWGGVGGVWRKILADAHRHQVQCFFSRQIICDLAATISRSRLPSRVAERLQMLAQFKLKGGVWIARTLLGKHRHTSKPSHTPNPIALWLKHAPKSISKMLKVMFRQQ